MFASFSGNFAWPLGFIIPNDWNRRSRNCWGHSPRSWWLVAPIVRWKPGTTPRHRAAQLGQRWDCENDPIITGKKFGTLPSGLFLNIFVWLKGHIGDVFFEMSVLFLFGSLGKDGFGENCLSFFGHCLGGQEDSEFLWETCYRESICFFVEGVSIDTNHASKNLEEMRKRVC